MGLVRIVFAFTMHHDVLVFGFENVLKAVNPSINPPIVGFWPRIPDIFDRSLGRKSSPSEARRRMSYRRRFLISGEGCSPRQFDTTSLLG